MKIENQVCTLQQAKKLKELGVKQESTLYWIHDNQLAYPDNEYNGNKRAVITYGIYGRIGVEVTEVSIIASAFTVAELGEMIVHNSDRRAVYRIDGVWKFVDEKTDLWNEFTTEAQARAAILIHLIESSLLSV